jgi:hypothetical protein
MKNEPLFKFVALAIVVGVFMAFASAARAYGEKVITRPQSVATDPKPNP